MLSVPDKTRVSAKHYNVTLYSGDNAQSVHYTHEPTPVHVFRYVTNCNRATTLLLTYYNRV